ncbi:MAG TPA: SDR family NAD(P)-dependent oxidoreductase [Acidimicrobiales bacterium]|nr:SDR family NAD(P)-dependent oxidoreductase [Acidimicrobiales bacterium]
MRVEGATILVTGASSGIGEALAPMLAERGATVGIVARRADRLTQTLARCRRHAPGSRMWVADLSDVDASVQLVHDAWTAFGALDCLVNNAAVGKRKLVTDHTAEDLDVVMRTNFLSPIRMNLAILPLMLGRGSGTIVNVASGGGRFGIVHESAYCASKFAMSGWSEAAAMDLADTPVELKLVQPGAIATEIWDQRPGELPGLTGGEFATAAQCAAGIVDAMETDGFEFFVPADLKAHVDYKNSDIQGWIDLMADIGRAQGPTVS